MKLIAEVETCQPISKITESLDENNERSLFIEGIFAQAEKPNRNNRVYPKSVLHSAISNYIRDYVDQNRAIGELNHPNCYIDKNWEVLTPTGWKSFEDMKIGDPLYTMNNKGMLEIGKVINIINEKINNDIVTYYFGENGINSIVTENHRFYCVDEDNTIVIKTAKELYENPKGYKIIRCSKANGNTDNIKVIINDKEKSFSPAPLCKFIGYWLDCGTYENNNIVFTNNDNIISLLNELSIVYNIENDKIIISDEFILELLTQNEEKYIPNKIKLLHSDYLIGILESLEKIDNPFYNDKNFKLISYITPNKTLIKDLNEITIKCGLGCSVTNVKDNYKISFLFDNIDVSLLTIDKRVNTKINVYCLSTNNGNFYIKHNGYQYLTGNSAVPNPERACILIKKLEWDHNDVYGKAKILHTPLGETVRALVTDGVQLGVSTRGVGSLHERNGVSMVENDYTISAIDVVSNPSGIDCWVNGIMENVEYYYDNGLLTEATIEEYQRHIRQFSVQNMKIDFAKFLKQIKI